MIIFQYPPSDRTRCNKDGKYVFDARDKSFSILHRIEPAVTGSPAAQEVMYLDFQYPPSDRTRCNCCVPSRSRTSWSTFSILHRIEPAVTTISDVITGLYHAFSILHRIEPAVTATGTITAVYLYLFQYPPSDRTRCNLAKLGEALV